MSNVDVSAFYMPLQTFVNPYHLNAIESLRESLSVRSGLDLNAVDAGLEPGRRKEHRAEHGQADRSDRDRLLLQARLGGDGAGHGIVPGCH